MYINNQNLWPSLTTGVNAAKQALLTFMVGGPDSKFPEAQEILQNMGKNVVHCGAVGTGQVRIDSAVQPTVNILCSTVYIYIWKMI